VTCDPRQADGAELIGRAGRALQRSWRPGAVIAQVLVSMPERCVFVAASPDGGQVVVKSDIRPGRLAAEREVLTAAGAAGLPVPAIVHGAGGPLPLLVLEYIRGQALSSASPGPVWAEAGRLLRRLHGLDVPGRIGPGTGRRPLRWFLSGRATADAAAAARHGLITAEQAASLARLLGEQFREAAEPGRECLLHGDAQPAHYVVAGTGPLANRAKVPRPAGLIAAMLDFGDACTGDPVWDLAVLTLDDPGRLDDVLTGYAPEPALARRVRRLIRPYRLLRRLGEAVWLHAHGLDAGPSAALLRAAAADPGPARQPGAPGPVIR
jgi:aminoglycoside phosphotransferase (APT) family kinase protein